MDATTLKNTNVDVAMRRSFGGDLRLPSDDRYDAGRLPWNRAIDPRPAIVAEAIDQGDIRVAVLAARNQGLPLAVQSTGHGAVVAADGALLLRTSRMSGVRVDPYHRTATTGPGALWSDVIAAAARYGLAPLSGTPSVGVAGYTLGGGTGWLSRKHGFAADSLLRAEVVTAQGAVVTADAEHYPDLFWALRGGSGNFGLVTSLEFRLYPVTNVYAGLSLYPIERAAATLARFRDWAPTEPDELNTAVLLFRVPDTPQIPAPLRGRQALAIRAFYLGRYEEATEALDPLLAAAGPPIVDGFRSMTFMDAGQALAGPARPPTAFRQHIDLFEELTDDLVETLLDAARDGSAIELRHWGGAMARPAPDAGPVGHRDTPYSVMTTGVHDTPAERGRVIAQLADLAARLAPYATGGSFLNFLTDPMLTGTAFTAADLSRLREVKAVWDPDNFFHLNHNIAPVNAAAAP